MIESGLANFNGTAYNEVAAITKTSLSFPFRRQNFRTTQLHYDTVPALCP